MASVTVVNAKKSFGAVEVLKGVDIDMADGEFVVLVGPSGCGKTTLLRMIAGLETITEGDILIGERRVNNLAPKDRDIAMVFQSYALYPHMDVFRNMGFSLALRGSPLARRRGVVGRAADTLGLSQLLARLPRELSGGQRQRVAMGRAIVREPVAFLFDEPLSNLDAKLRVAMRAEIKKLHRKIGTTSVYVTHDQVEAMTMADRIVVMEGGVAQQIGAPLEIYDRPANLFVAGFIGSPAMNFAAGTYRRVGDTAYVDTGEVHLPAPADAALKEGAAVVHGIRPEHIGLDAPGAAGAVAARVEIVEPTGIATLIHASAGRFDLNIFTTDRVDPPIGGALALNIDPRSCHLFDQDSGERVVTI